MEKKIGRKSSSGSNLSFPSNQGATTKMTPGIEQQTIDEHDDENIADKDQPKKG